MDDDNLPRVDDPETNEPRLYRTSEVAAILNVSPRDISNFRRKDPTRRLVGKRYRWKTLVRFYYLRVDIEDFARRFNMTATFTD